MPEYPFVHPDQIKQVEVYVTPSGGGVFIGEVKNTSPIQYYVACIGLEEDLVAFASALLEAHGKAAH